MAPQRDGDLTSGLLIAFDDGIGGCEDGAAQLLSSIVEDDDTPGKLLYYHPPSVAVEKVYFLLGFVIQASRLLADLQGSSNQGPLGLLAAKRRLAHACMLHRRLGAACAGHACVPAGPSPEPALPPSCPRAPRRHGCHRLRAFAGCRLACGRRWRTR